MSDLDCTISKLNYLQKKCILDRFSLRSIPSIRMTSYICRVTNASYGDILLVWSNIHGKGDLSDDYAPSDFLKVIQ